MTRRGRWWGPVILAATVALLFGIDRLLLAHVRRPVWEYDPVLMFRHRPNLDTTWGTRPPAYPLRTNRWGHYDDDLPMAKPSGEWRAAFVGDSIVLGYGFPYQDALPNALERSLAARGSGPTQVINLGVAGYSTEQYPEVVRRALPFAPDLVLLGFCMNDVLGPYMHDPQRGANWHAYREVAETTNPRLAWVVTETGFGRLALRVRSWLAEPTFSERRLRYGPEWLARHSRDDDFARQEWQRALGELDAAVAAARGAGLPFVLVVFPQTFQIGHPELLEPQRILADWAARRGVPILDVTALLQGRVDAGEPVNTLYIDEVHFWPRGSTLLAEALADFLVARHLAPGAAPAPPLTP